MTYLALPTSEKSVPNQLALFDYNILTALVARFSEDLNKVKSNSLSNIVVIDQDVYTDRGIIYDSTTVILNGDFNAKELIFVDGGNLVVGDGVTINANIYGGGTLTITGDVTITGNIGSPEQPVDSISFGAKSNNYMLPQADMNNYFILPVIVDQDTQIREREIKRFKNYYEKVPNFKELFHSIIENDQQNAEDLYDIMMQQGTIAKHMSKFILSYMTVNGFREYLNNNILDKELLEISKLNNNLFFGNIVSEEGYGLIIREIDQISILGQENIVFPN
jgi:hypothetical protein